MIFEIPDKLFATLPTNANGLAEAVDFFSDAPERYALPIIALQGSADPNRTLLDSQWLWAKSELDSMKYLNARRILLPGLVHDPVPAAQVFQYLDKSPKLFKDLNSIRAPVQLISPIMLTDPYSR